MKPAHIMAVAGSVVTLGAVIGVWQVYGWVTRGEYREDHLDGVTAQRILMEVQSAKEQQQHAHEHWQCDEWFEEMQEETDPAKRRNLEVRFDKLECWRFDTD